jgi:hypothetical protein
MADIISLPNEMSLRNLILIQYHNAGHPHPNRTLRNASKIFWWLRMQKTVSQDCNMPMRKSTRF